MTNYQPSTLRVPAPKRRRKYSEVIFDADYELPEETERLRHKQDVDAYVVRVREHYKPRRKMKRAQESGDASEDARYSLADGTNTATATATM